MSASSSREEHLFVVRLWREPAARNGEWRASIVHVESGQRLATTELRAIDDFIRLRITPEDDEIVCRELRPTKA